MLGLTSSSSATTTETALVPRRSLLLLTALLPFYYARFAFMALDQVWLFDNVLVWLEYLPVLALLLIEWRRGRV